MKILGILLFAVVAVAVTAKHRKEWQRVDPLKASRERLQIFFKSDMPACIRGAGFYRDPHDCHQFIRCVDEYGSGRHFSVFVGRCEPGLVFDENVSACNWPELSAPCSSSSEKLQESRKPVRTEQVAQDNVVSNEHSWEKPYQQEVFQSPQQSDSQQEILHEVQDIQIVTQKPTYQEEIHQVGAGAQSFDQSIEEQGPQEVYQENERVSENQQQSFEQSQNEQVPQEIYQEIAQVSVSQQQNFEQSQEEVPRQPYEENVEIPIKQQQSFEESSQEEVKPASDSFQESVRTQQQQNTHEKPAYEQNDKKPTWQQVPSNGFHQVVDQQNQQFEISANAEQGQVPQGETQSQWWIPENTRQHNPPNFADQIPVLDGEEQPIYCSEEGFFRHPDNCSQFIRCVKIEREAFAVHFFECPKQLAFSEKDSSCIVADVHSCRSNKRKKRQASSAKLQCRSEGFFRHPQDCRAFYRCVKTESGSYETHLFSCPANLVFDEEYTTCNWPDKAAPCQSQGQQLKTTRKPVQTERKPYKPPTRSTNKQPMSTTKPRKDMDTSISGETFGRRRTTEKPRETTRAYYKDEPKCRSQGIFRNEKDCTKYVKCVKKGNYYERSDHSCPQNKAFDDKNKRCISQRYVTSCNRKPPYPPRQDDEETTTSAQSSNPSSSENDDIVCEKEGYFRHPDDCNKFYRCVDFKGDGQEFVRYDFNCPEGLVFDEVNSVCNWPSESEPCDKRSGGGSNPGESDSTTSRAPDGEEDAPEESPETSGNDQNTSDGDESTENSPGENPSSDSGSDTSSTTEPSDDSATGSRRGGGNNNGECTEAGFFRNPEDCNKFYRCVDHNGDGQEFVKYDFKCPEGLVFDETNSVCNWPDQSAPCEGGNSGGDQDTTTREDGSDASRSTSSGEDNSSAQTTSDSTSNTDENSSQSTDGNDSVQSTTEGSNNTPSRGDESGSTSDSSDGESGGETGDNEGECTKEGYFRNPEDCGKFYRCVDFNGDGQQFVRYDFECPEGLVFDEVNSVCNWPDQSPKCETRGGSDTEETTSSQEESSSQVETSSEQSSDSTESSSDQSTEQPAQGSTEQSTTKRSTSGDNSECSEPGFYRCKDDCSKFYRCVEEDGELVRYDFTCPDGLIFDDRNKKCDWPSSELTCESDSSTSAGTTSSDESSTTVASTVQSTTQSTTSSTNSGTSSDSSSSKECTEEGFFRNPDDCSKYYRCIDEGDGTFTREDFSCAEDEVFDEEMRYCNRKDLAPPCDGSQTSSQSQATSSQSETTSETSTQSTTERTTSSQTSTQSSTKSDSKSDCTQPGFFRCPEDCTKFYRCVEENGDSENLVRYDFQCPDGLIFDERNDKCDWPSAELTCDTESSSSDTTQSTTASSQTSDATSSGTSSSTSSPDSTSSASSEGCTEEGFFRDPEDCSKYYRCLDEGDGTLTREDFACEEDEVFDEEMRYCNRKDLAPPCDETSSTDSSEGSTTQSSSKQESESTTSSSESTSSSSDQESESTTSSSESTSSSSDQESESTTSSSSSSGSGECQEEGFHRDPNDCSKFYRCVDFKGDGQSFTRYDFDCPEGLVFDETLDVCNWPSSVPSCESSGESRGSTAGGSSSTASDNSGSSTSTDVESSTSEEQTTSTPRDGASTTDNESTSNSASDSTTSGAGTTSSGSSTSGDTASRGGSSGDIECTEEGFYRHPEDCNKFYRCVDFAGTGESFVRYDFDCPEGLVFDEVNSVCNWPNQTPKCESGSGKSSSENESTTDSAGGGSTASDTSSQSTSETTGNTGTTSQGAVSTTSRDQTTATSSSSTGSTSSEEEFRCENEGYFKHPTDCKKYYECKRDEETGELVKIDCECPDGQVWDNEGWYCNAEDLSPPCDSNSSFKCKEEGFFRDPEDCTRYYQCNRTGPGENDFRTEHFQCNEGLVFDEGGRYCNAPELSEPCDESSSGSTDSDGSSSTTSSGTSDGQGQCTKEGFFRNQEDCTKYYQCSKNDDGSFNRKDYTCPDGRIFDEGSTYCNDPELSEEPCDTDNSSDSSTSQQPTSSNSASSDSGDSGSSSPSTGTRGSGGECTQEGYFRNPDDCNKFYRCVDFSGSGESYVRYDFDCPEGLHFDEVNSVCNWPTMTPPCESSNRLLLLNAVASH